MAAPANPASPAPAASPVAPAGSPPAIGLDPVATGFASPLGIVSSHDGTNRLFVVEQGGTVRIIENGSVRPLPFLDVRGRTLSGGERGLLGLAFHPDYRCNGRFFVDYTDRNGNTVVAEYGVSADNPDRADPDAVATLLHITQPFPNHNGGDLVFGPDRMLYIGMGDGGSGGDPSGNGQSLNAMLGKLLRIDVDHPSGGNPYGIPDGNCAGCAEGALREIYAYGLRNPWRFTFDRANGDLWIGDVGQGKYEEIDTVAAGQASGRNFGWNRMEGRHCYPDGDSCDKSGLTLPITEVDHSSGDCSITGGYVYRGSAIPGLVGRFLYSDFCSGIIRQLDPGAADGAPSILLQSGRNIVSFGEDDAGELYVADIGNGAVLKVVA